VDAIEIKGVMVRPSGFEPPTFCSGGNRSMCILLTSMAARTSFRANRRRTKAAVDERLMKGLRRSHFQNHFFDSFLPASDVSPRRPANANSICGPRPSHRPACRSPHSPSIKTGHANNFATAREGANILGIPGAGDGVGGRPFFLKSGQQFSEFPLFACLVWGEGFSECPAVGPGSGGIFSPTG
jgi:hypothetical protein